MGVRGVVDALELTQGLRIGTGFEVFTAPVETLVEIIF
tara:strand:- start:273 stop:386 length:114 start_codon:yes stop_codon:yes gene_type:complete